MLDSSLEHQSSCSEIHCVTFSKQNKDSLLVHDRPRIRLFSIKKKSNDCNQPRAKYLSSSPRTIGFSHKELLK